MRSTGSSPERRRRTSVRRRRMNSTAAGVKRNMTALLRGGDLAQVGAGPHRVRRGERQDEARARRQDLLDDLAVDVAHAADPLAARDRVARAHGELDEPAVVAEERASTVVL